MASSRGVDGERDAAVQRVERQDGEVANVVVVAVGQEQGFDPALLGEGERGRERASVEGKDAVDQQRDEARGAALLVVGPKDSQLHVRDSQRVWDGRRRNAGIVAHARISSSGAGRRARVDLTAQKASRYHGCVVPG